jgi:hypothetical protein
MTRALAFVLSAVLAASTISCGGSAPPPPDQSKREKTVSWADVFDGVPDLYVVLRPQAIKRDGVYGAFFKSLVRAAQARTNARGDTMVQAVEGADDVILGLGQGDDAAIVLRGVPASLDPQKIVDASGASLFRPLSDRTKVVEYELLDRKATEAGALFVLPDRTWVGTLGTARGRARQAFTTPMNRPVPSVDPDALAVVRASGPLAHVLEKHPVFGPLSKKLTSATFSLRPGKGGLVVELRYGDADRAAWAESEGKQAVAELTKDGKRPWLKDAKVAYEGNSVFIRVALPPRLLEELPNASGADLLL